MWVTDFIPERARPASDKAIAKAESRLGVTIPEVLKAQLRVRNGGHVFLSEKATPFEKKCRLWTNAVVDGILPVQQWETAAASNWFDSVSDVPALDLMVVLAGHSESQLCLDFRSSGAAGTPSVAYVDACTTPTELTTLAKTPDEFVAAIIKSKGRSPQG
jgi:hypothetical protein